MEFEKDPKTLERLRYIVDKAALQHIKIKDLYCLSSKGSKSNAIARIYSFPKAFQIAFGSKPKYVIELISERYNKLPEDQKDRVLIHELMHIPKSFSGGLVPHKCFGKKRICGKTVEALYKQFKENCDA